MSLTSSKESMRKILKVPYRDAKKTGWPWTEGSDPLFDRMPDGSPWPKISIVTPSYNQAQYLEETIRSVILQGYPNLEYIIIDGGSTDSSVEIIKKYEPWLTYWVSEKDRGQSQAINKGFSYSTGEIMAWINSDDYYEASVLIFIASAFKQHETQWISGNCRMLYDQGETKHHLGKPSISKKQWLISNQYIQPECFWQRSLWLKTDGIDESLHYSFDYDLWLKFSDFQPYPLYFDKVYANFRIHENSKTGQGRNQFDREDLIIFKRYRRRLLLREQIELWKNKHEITAYHYLSHEHRKDNLSVIIIRAILSATWLSLKRKFYSKAKQILLSC